MATIEERVQALEQEIAARKQIEKTEDCSLLRREKTLERVGVDARRRDERTNAVDTKKREHESNALPQIRYIEDIF